MRLSSVSLFAIGFLLLACGARSSYDELLGGDGAVGVGSSFSSGGLATGGFGTGGFGTGGPMTGGVGGTTQGSCCVAKDGPGCADPAVQECVCRNDPVCCNSGWDQVCVDTVQLAGCGSCGIGGQPTGGAGGMPAVGGGGIAITGGTGSGGFAVGGGGGNGNCCDAHNSPMCDDPEITDCVCSADPFCCTGTWDAQCVSGTQMCGAECSGTGGAPTTGGAGGISGGGTGAAPSGGGVGAAPSGGGAPSGGVGAAPAGGGVSAGGTGAAPSGGGMPSGGAPPTGGAPSGGAPSGGAPSGGTSGTSGSCCDNHLGQGCNDPDVQQCVCDIDDFCCTTAWDGLCVNEAQHDCGAPCSPPEGNCCAFHDSPGCVDTGIAACVCANEPTCCEDAWHAECAQIADYACGANCIPGTGGAGGSGGTGGTGSGAAGGMGGLPQCDGLAGCAACTCDNCYGELSTCGGDLGCLEIFNCVVDAGCVDSLCVLSSCAPVIDAHGGVVGGSFSRAVALASCSAASGCACP